MERYNLDLSIKLIYDIVKAYYDVDDLGDNLYKAIECADWKYGLNQTAACIFDQMYINKLTLDELNEIDPDSFCELVSLYDNEKFGLLWVEYGNNWDE